MSGSETSATVLPPSDPAPSDPAPSEIDFERAPGTPPPPKSRWWHRLRRLIDSGAVLEAEHEGRKGIDWVRMAPVIGMHLMCLGVIWVGVSWIAVAVAAGLYAIRMFAITAFYHRYFSHRSFKTNRFWQFCFGVLGNSAVQRGPIWWAATHRHHHRFSDQPEDSHSPVQDGFWYSHIGWVAAYGTGRTRSEAVPDLLKFPELRFLDRFHVLVPILLAVSCWLLGGWLDAAYPGLGTSAGQMLIWGFFVSTVVLAHGTFTINSLSHLFGKRRYKTTDDSRNNVWLALITFGEGWHNNHHHYPSSARQGFYWWEIDMSYYGLKVLSWLGIVRELKGVPEKARQRHAS